jgi:hypothetical protein
VVSSAFHTRNYIETACRIQDVTGSRFLKFTPERIPAFVAYASFLCRSGQIPLATTCRNGDKLYGTIKNGEFVDQVSYDQLLPHIDNFLTQTDRETVR